VPNQSNRGSFLGGVSLNHSRTNELRDHLRRYVEQLEALIRQSKRGLREHESPAGSESSFEAFQGGGDGTDPILLDSYTRTLQQVRVALARLDHGEYGRCTECGADIATARLLALPFASRCRPCEERNEERPKRFLPARQA
jgi:DnaK suppressor protein